MNPKVVWKIWCEPMPENPFIEDGGRWGSGEFQTRAAAQNHNEVTGGSKGMFWTFLVRKFPKGRKT